MIRELIEEILSRVKKDGDWLYCDECGHRHYEGEKGYWGYYGTKLCCPVCLHKHYKKDMER